MKLASSAKSIEDVILSSVKSLTESGRRCIFQLRDADDKKFCELFPWYARPHKPIAPCPYQQATIVYNSGNQYHACSYTARLEV